MKCLPVLLLALAVLGFSCEKDDDGSDNAIIPGRYIGTFSRSGGDTSNIVMSFTAEGHFEGSSSQSRYPAVCRGSYYAENNRLFVTDSCAWTADFDWTLIFNGEYHYERQGNQLRIWRTSGSITDEYRIGIMSR
ncbi:hypothetical protein JMG10_28350 [Nostoc ellipsosporum NOK]|nr:hypothetical protein [Nostoc ellipsosporum NOK]